MPRMAGLLIEITDDEVSPDTALQLVPSMAPQRMSITSIHRGSGNHNRRVGRENLHILYTFLLSSASATCLFFFPL